MSAPSCSLLSRFRNRGLALLLGLLAAAAGNAANRDVYLYQGADRAERLVAQAKKEGTLVLYSTMTLEDAAPLLAAFEKKYGIKVNMWRAVNQKLVQRTLAEARAGKLAADAFEGSGPGLEILHQEGCWKSSTARRSPTFRRRPFRSTATTRPTTCSSP